MASLSAEVKLSIGFSAMSHSPSSVANYFSISSSVVHYWKRKVAAGAILTKHGGYRWSKFSPEERIKIQRFIFEFISQHEGMVRRREIKEHLLQNGFDLSTTYISRVLHAWGWSFKVPTRVNVRKFTETNVEYYFNYFAWAKHQPIAKLKFCDESHFNSNSTF